MLPPRAHRHVHPFAKTLEVARGFTPTEVFRLQLQAGYSSLGLGSHMLGWLFCCASCLIKLAVASAPGLTSSSPWTLEYGLISSSCWTFVYGWNRPLPLPLPLPLPPLYCSCKGNAQAEEK